MREQTAAVSLTAYAALGTLGVFASVHADVIEVPGDFVNAADAATVAVSGDTILVFPGSHAVYGALTLAPGVVLSAQDPGQSTTLGFSLSEDRLVLSGGAADTTVVENLGLYFTSSSNHTSIEVLTSSAIIRGNVLAGSSNQAIILRNGGVVTDNLFKIAAGIGITAEGGTSRISYNTWNVECAFSFYALSLGGAAERVVVQNNSFRGAQVAWAAPESTYRYEFFNNIFTSTSFVCDLDTNDPYADFHHNILVDTSFGVCDDVAWGVGNLELSPEEKLFCDPLACWELFIHELSPAVGAGENGENLGAWPIGCGVSPVDTEGQPTPPSPLPFIGLPRPNPSSGLVTLRFSSDAVDGLTLDVFDAAGRQVRILRADAGATRIVWDGTSASGRPVGSGTYFLRERTTGATRSVRVLR